MDKTKDLKTPPSDEFMEAVVHFSTESSIECELCERVHFVDREVNSYEEGELEELREQQSKEPDRYLSSGDDISWGYLDRKQVVEDCPCNRASMYEAMIVNNMSIISDYLSKRAERLARESQSESKLAKSVQESVKLLS